VGSPFTVGAVPETTRASHIAPSGTSCALRGAKEAQAFLDRDVLEGLRQGGMREKSPEPSRAESVLHHIQQWPAVKWTCLLRDFEVDLPASVVLAEGFAVHLVERLRGYQQLRA